MKIAVFSGSFDPIHNAHIAILNAVLEEKMADEAWLLVTPQNPLKSSDDLSSFTHRYKMALLAAGKKDKIKVSDFEKKLPSPSYTYQTLCALKATYPQHEFLLVIGSDNLQNFGKWRDGDKIISRFGIIVYPRNGCECKEISNPNIRILYNCPSIDVSSTMIRNLIKDDRPVNSFIPEVVNDYIKQNKLYKSK